MPARATLPEIQSPFSRVLTDYMWSKKPPLLISQLAVRLKLSQETVRKWVYNNTTPNADNVMRVLRTLDIPLERLVIAYQESGFDTPPLTEADAQAERAAANAQYLGMETTSAPTPKPTSSPSASDTQWQIMIEQTRRQMEAAGLDEPTIASVLDHIAEKRANQPPLARHIAAEHTEQNRQEGEPEPKRTQRKPSASTSAAAAPAPAASAHRPRHPRH